MHEILRLCHGSRYDAGLGVADRGHADSGTDARLQILRISWDTVKKQWFDCPPPDARERLSPD
ncbi:MAG: hypothetical protein R6W83_08980, partial [Cryobacterium sp.]